MNNKLKIALTLSLVIGFIGTWLVFFTQTSAITAESSDTLPPFDPATLYVRETVAVPYANKLALAPDRSLLYVAQWSEGGSQTGVTAVDTVTYATTPISSLHAGFPQDIQFSFTGSLAYVAISRRNSSTTLPSTNNRIDIVDTTTHAVTGTILTDSTNPYGPTRMVLSPNGTLAYVTRRGPSQLDVINITTNTVVTTIASGLGNYAVAITPTGDRVYTVNREGNSVSVINTATNAVIATIPLSMPTSVALVSIAITSDGNKAFIVGTSSGTIVVVDTNPASPTYHQQIDSIPTTGSSLGEIALTLDDHYAFVTSRTADELLVVDIDPGSVTYRTQVGQVTVGDNPFSVVIEYQMPGIIAYVSNHGNGTVSVIGYQEAITGLAAANSSPTIIGNSTHLTATITAGTDVTYTWAFGDGSYGNGITPTYTYPTLGNYTAIVTATNQVSQMTATTSVEVVDTPIVGLTASNSSPTIVGNATFFNASTTSGANIQYTWAFGDGSYGNGPTPIHTYPAVGNYTAIVTATNSNNSLSATTSVTVIDVAISGLVAANDSPTIISNPTHLSATVSGGTNVQYTWAFGDGSYGNGANPTHIYPAVGNYTAIVTATNSNNTLSTTTSVSVIDVAIFGLAAANDSPTIVGNNTHLFATVSGGTNIQYTWAFGDGTYGNGANPTHAYPSVGNYTAIVTATNTNNSLSASTSVQVIDVAVSGLAAANDSPTIVGNNTHLFATVSGGTNIQYTWAFGDGTYGSGASPSHAYPAVGNYTAIVTATNSNNSQSASTLVTIEFGITYTYLPMVSFCEATPIWADIALVIDTSGSMADPTEPGGVSKLVAAQTAAATFLTFLDFTNQRDQASLISFDNIATLEHPLSRNETTLLNAINSLQLGNLTRMDLGLQTARLELTGVRHDPDNQTVIIFLTDGYPNGTTEAEVLAQALLAKNAGITIFTIGLGSDVNSSLLQAVASTPAYYYASPSTGDLSAIYQQIASSLACR